MRNAQPPDHPPLPKTADGLKNCPFRLPGSWKQKLESDYSELHTADELYSESTLKDSLYQAFRGRLSPPGCALDY